MPPRKRVAHTKKKTDDNGDQVVHGSQVPSWLTPTNSEARLSDIYETNLIYRNQRPQVMTRNAGKFDLKPKQSEQNLLYDDGGRGNSRVFPQSSANYDRPLTSTTQNTINTQVRKIDEPYSYGSTTPNLSRRSQRNLNKNKDTLDNTSTQLPIRPRWPNVESDFESADTNRGRANRDSNAEGKLSCNNAIRKSKSKVESYFSEAEGNPNVSFGNNIPRKDVSTYFSDAGNRTTRKRLTTTKQFLIPAVPEEIKKYNEECVKKAQELKNKKAPIPDISSKNVENKTAAKIGSLNYNPAEKNTKTKPYFSTGDANINLNTKEILQVKTKKEKDLQEALYPSMPLLFDDIKQKPPPPKKVISDSNYRLDEISRQNASKEAKKSDKFSSNFITKSSTPKNGHNDLSFRLDEMSRKNASKEAKRRDEKFPSVIITKPSTPKNVMTDSRSIESRLDEMCRENASKEAKKRDEKFPSVIITKPSTPNNVYPVLKSKLDVLSRENASKEAKKRDDRCSSNLNLNIFPKYGTQNNENVNINNHPKLEAIQNFQVSENVDPIFDFDPVNNFSYEIKNKNQNHFDINPTAEDNKSIDQDFFDLVSALGESPESIKKYTNIEDEVIDKRLNDEIQSIYDAMNINNNISDPFQNPEPLSEAEIDARLQSELDSLPMVEPERPLESTRDSIPQIPRDAVQNFPEYNKLPRQNEVFNHPLAATSTNHMINNAMAVVGPGLFPGPSRVAPNHHRTLTQVPIVTRLKGAQGEDISVKYTTGPDGLITNVQMEQPSIAKGKELESFTASQLHQILQSGQPYMSLPMTNPGAMPKEPLKVKDTGILPEQAVEDEEVDYEEIGVADTFAAYWPSKLKFGKAHPDPVVETATLSSVELPDITYQLSLPSKTMDCLSALQLEAVVYACQAHEQILPSGDRAGFLLGDGAGVGKGRTIAGIIMDNFIKGRKRALWVSVSNDLKFDAERDLADIGASEKINVVAISKFKYSRIDSEENDNFKRGVIFCTYTALIGESLTANSSKYRTRLRQLVQWLGKKFDGVIVFDECHKAKNLSLMNVGKSTKTGTTVMELQQMLPKARVVYASATGASEPRNMAYMERLGLWGSGTAYPEFYDFVNAVEKRGIGAMEIVAMDMKLRGTYIARQLSFKDVSFRIEEVPMSKEFRKCYNMAAELWAEINKKFLKACRLMCIENRVQKIITCQFWCAHQRFFKNLCIASKVNHVVKMTRRATRMGKAVVIGLQSTGESRTIEHLDRHDGRLSNFVSTSKMIIQSFVEKHFPAPKRDSFHTLLNTGQFVPETRSCPQKAKRAKMNSEWFDDDMDAEAGESDIEMYESNWRPDDDRLKTGQKRRGRPPKAKMEKITMQERILVHLHNNMKAQDNDADATYTFDNTKPQKANITERDVERCINSRELLLEKIENLGRKLPPNTLDKLISELGGTNMVAEMTGRRGRVVRSDGYKYEPRGEDDSTMDLVNYREKQRFMDGSKHVAIISEAASSGISLQSDKRVSNQRRRLHITLELPWSADRAIQQFGRTHRSNQVNSPEYVFVITDLAGERRFASTVAKRLESLGALTQGDRRATDARDLSQFNIDNSIGRNALDTVMQQLVNAKPVDPAEIPQSYEGDFLYDCSVSMAGVGMLNVREEDKVKVFSVEKDSSNISKFLNRILGCRVEIQNALFKFFLDKMYTLIMQMKRTGRFDLGILDLDAHGASVKSVKLMRFIRNHATGTAATELHTVTVERGMSFEAALAKYRKEGQHEHDGFYILQQLRHNKNASILCLQSQPNSTDGSTGKVNLQIFRPNTGPQVRLESLNSIASRYIKVKPEEARDLWQKQFDLCLNTCSHLYWNRKCPCPTACEVGLRVRTYHVLSGLMLPIWDRIEQLIDKSGHKIQIIRVKTDVNKKIVGTVVPHAVYNDLVKDLSTDSIVESL